MFVSSKVSAGSTSRAAGAATGRRAAAAVAPVSRSGPSLSGGRRCTVVRSADDTGFFSSAFKDALSSAMERDRAAAQDMYSSSVSSNGGSDYSRADAYERSSRRREEHNAAADPLVQVLATALSQSRATLERLQVEEAEIEALIQRERKQVERLEFALDKTRRDQAYYQTLSRRFEEEGKRSGDPRW